MPRYELSNWLSKKFWEIELEGNGFQVRFGKIGSKGQTTSKQFASEAHARREYDRLVAEKTGKGYKLVTGNEPVLPAAPAAPPVSNPELEAAIDAHPDDLTAYQVYGDWLQAQNHPRGELIALMAAGKDHQAFLAANAATFVGGIEDLVQTSDGNGKPGLTWRWGFVEKLRLAHDHDAADEDLDLGEAVQRALAHPSLRFVQALELGINRGDGEAEYGEVVEALASEVRPTLRSLFIADFEFPDENEMSWTHLGDLGPLWKQLPNLRKLIVQGGSFELGELVLPELREASFRTGGLSNASFQSILNARWPKLEKLEIWFGDDGYGAEVTFEQLAPLLEGKNLPNLRHLGLMNAQFSDDIAAAIGQAKIAPQLVSLDLSMGTLSDTGAAHLVAAARQLAKLEALDVSQSYLSEVAVDSLADLADHVEAGEQKGEGEDDADRYVSVGE